MPIMRNPFKKQDENARPDSKHGVVVDSNGATKPVDIAADKTAPEYKLSEINDSGVYLPPSPTERKSFWTTSSRSTTSSNVRSVFNENEPFNISRESFDSYRRSFDISARSPVIQPNETRARGSLDSRTFQPPPPRMSLDARPYHPPPPRSSNSFQRPSQVPAETQEEFEDVDISEPKPQQPKKRGIFSRIVDGGDDSSSKTGTDGKSSWHHFGGRKRGQSGQGAELDPVIKRDAASTPKPSDLQHQVDIQPASVANVVPKVVIAAPVSSTKTATVPSNDIPTQKSAAATEAATPANKITPPVEEVPASKDVPAESKISNEPIAETISTPQPKPQASDIRVES